MPELVYRVCWLLEQVVSSVYVGTNLSLYYLLMALLSGRFLPSRGAVSPALSDFGLPAACVRRSAAALESGHFQIDRLLAAWQTTVLQTAAASERFCSHCYEGFRPVALDLVGFFRPRLGGGKSSVGKHYTSQAGKALPAVVLAMVAAVGSIGAENEEPQGRRRFARFALPRLFLPALPPEQTGKDGQIIVEKESDLQRRAITQAAQGLAPCEALIVDAGFALSDLRQSGARFVARADKNFTARRNTLPEYKGYGRHAEYGEVVRPLGRKRAGRPIPATPPDAMEEWEDRKVGKDGKYTLCARMWHNLVTREQKACQTGEETDTVPFTCVAIFDPRYNEPWVLVSNLPVSAQALWRLYRDRWAIEQMPLAAKQMLGTERAFVFGNRSRFRLPQLALLAGNILTYLAATREAVATGFWDRMARPTCGRLRRTLSRLHFSDLPALHGQLREKKSVFAHLPKGIEAHRRQKRLPV